MKESSNEAIEPILFESETQLGGTFRYRSYENGEMVSSRQLTSFSDFRLAANETGENPDHVSMEQYCKYLNDYAEWAGFYKGIGWDGKEGHVRFRRKVMKIEKDPSRTGHLVTYLQGTSDGTWDMQGIDLLFYHFGLFLSPHTFIVEISISVDAIAVCAGLHVTPAMPCIPGVENVTKNEGTIIHSKDYKKEEQLAGKSVLILGVRFFI